MLQYSINTYCSRSTFILIKIASQICFGSETLLLFVCLLFLKELYNVFKTIIFVLIGVNTATPDEPTQ